MKIHQRIKRALNRRYKFIIVDNTNLEEISSFSSTLKHSLTSMGALLLFLFMFYLLVLNVTGLHNVFFPGNTQENSQKLQELFIKLDSIETNLKVKDLYLQNLKKVLRGEEITENIVIDTVIKPIRFNELNWKISDVEKQFRMEVKKEDELKNKK